MTTHTSSADNNGNSEGLLRRRFDANPAPNHVPAPHMGNEGKSLGTTPFLPRHPKMVASDADSRGDEGRSGVVGSTYGPTQAMASEPGSDSHTGATPGQRDQGQVRDRARERTGKADSPKLRRTGLGRHLAVAHDTEKGIALPDRFKQCYREAFLFVQKYGDGGWELVHGELTGWAVLIHGFGERYHHAWAEKDGMLYEPLHDLIYVKEFYETFAGPVELYRYDKRRAARMALETEHYGPWEGPHAPH